MPRFFCTEPVQQNTSFALDARVAQHVRVLRLREGEAITLFDGNGGEVPATLELIGKRDVTVVTATHIDVEREAARAVTLHPSLIANDRFDWLIQKATELGVATIRPTYTERSQRIPGDVDKRAEHWRAVAIAACEQCGRNRIPEIFAPLTLAEALTSAESQYSVLLDAEAETATGSSTAVDASCAVFIGPEGGFSPLELNLLRARCAHKLRIGRTILRAETAAIASLVWLGSSQ